jgi:hypothetical protein
MLFEYINQKYKYNRKRQWKLPAIFGVIILISMFLVVVFEQIGIFRKEQNLKFNHVYIGKSKISLNFFKKF